MKDESHLQILRQQLTVLTKTVEKLEGLKGFYPGSDEYNTLSCSLLLQTKALQAQAEVVHRQDRYR